MNHSHGARVWEGEDRKFSDFSRSSDCTLGVVSSDLTAELSKLAETQILECFMHKNQ